MFRVIANILIGITVASAPALAAAAKRPNIVIILADDLGYSDIGCYGSEIETPNLDRLAEKGLRFTQFYNTARCCPTRASLLTGVYPHQAGMGHMTGRPAPGHPGYAADLSMQTPTIAEVLRDSGYVTYMAGKWHVTNNDMPNKSKANWPINRGFDGFYGTVKGGGSYYDPAMLVRGDKPITPLSDEEYQPQFYYYTDAIADHACWFIKSNAQSPDPQKEAKPFFCYVAFTSPHWPLHAPAEVIEKYKGRYDAGYLPIREARVDKQKRLGLLNQKWQISAPAASWADVKNKQWEARCMEVYAAQVDRMDQNIGKIITTLEDMEVLDNTLILFLADNGGCAENMGRDVHQDRADAPATQPRQRNASQLDVFPRYTLDGRPIRDGEIVMPGGDDTYVAYGEGWANVSNTPFREYKHWVHEGGISTPLIAHWPSHIARQNQLESQPGHLIDLMATCIDVANANFPAARNGKPVLPMEGVSLVPAFSGKPVGRSQPIFFEHEGNRAVRDGQWKLVAKGAKGPWELYDMQSDRTETHDLAKDQPDRVKELATKWQRWAQRAQVLPLNAWAQKKAAAK